MWRWLGFGSERKLSRIPRFLACSQDWSLLWRSFQMECYTALWFISAKWAGHASSQISDVRDCDDHVPATALWPSSPCSHRLLSGVLGWGSWRRLFLGTKDLPTGHRDSRTADRPTHRSSGRAVQSEGFHPMFFLLCWGQGHVMVCGLARPCPFPHLSPACLTLFWHLLS